MRTTDSKQAPSDDSPVLAGALRLDLGAVPLMPGRYAIFLYLNDSPQSDSHDAEHVLWFVVTERDIWGTGQSPEPATSRLWWPTVFQLES